MYQVLNADCLEAMRGMRAEPAADWPPRRGPRGGGQHEL